jgi:hypothetical protein
MGRQSNRHRRGTRGQIKGHGRQGKLFIGTEGVSAPGRGARIGYCRVKLKLVFLIIRFNKNPHFYEFDDKI